MSNTETLRLLTRHAIVDGHDKGLCIVTRHPDGSFSVDEFNAEPPSTIQIDFPIELNTHQPGATATIAGKNINDIYDINQQPKR